MAQAAQTSGEVRIPAAAATPAESNAAQTSTPGVHAGVANATEGSKSRKPANTKFKQQQLPAWQPMLTARSVLPFLVAIGLAFIPIGIALYLSASNVVEIVKDYTDCENERGIPCYSVTENACTCLLPMSLGKPMGGPVFMYYALENYFQNHRKYVKSRDDTQLMGDWKNASIFGTKAGGGAAYPSQDCSPFARAGDAYAYVPCGAIANSLFNDSITLFYQTSKSGADSNITVPLLRTGIAWPSDKGVKYRNPPNANSASLIELTMKSNNLLSPPNWEKKLWQLDEENESNNGLQNEDLIVWMRTAAFPSFRKLYRRINHTEIFQSELPAGNYTLKIDYRYPVRSFEGRKIIVLSSVSWIGGRNIFLGVAYMTVGSCCLVLSILFFLVHIKWGKKPSEMMNVTAASHW